MIVRRLRIPPYLQVLKFVLSGHVKHSASKKELAPKKRISNNKKNDYLCARIGSRSRLNRRRGIKRECRENRQQFPLL
jgi:hypothetical protein